MKQTISLNETDTIVNDKIFIDLSWKLYSSVSFFLLHSWNPKKKKQKKKNSRKGFHVVQNPYQPSHQPFQYLPDLH